MERVSLLKSIVCDGKELIDMEDFLFEVRGKNLIATEKAKELNPMRNCEGQVQDLLAIVAANVLTFEKVRKALIERMKGSRGKLFLTGTIISEVGNEIIRHRISFTSKHCVHNSKRNNILE